MRIQQTAEASNYEYEYLKSINVMQEIYKKARGSNKLLSLIHIFPRAQNQNQFDLKFPIVLDMRARAKYEDEPGNELDLDDLEWRNFRKCSEVSELSSV